MTEIIINDFISNNKNYFSFNISNELKEQISSLCINIILNDETESRERLLLALECSKILARDISFQIYLCKEEFWNKIMKLSGISDYSKQVETSALLEHPAEIVEDTLKVLFNMTKNFYSTIPINIQKLAVTGILNRISLYSRNVPEIPTNIKIFDMKLLFLFTAFFSETRSMAVSDDDCIHRLSAIFEFQLNAFTNISEDDINLDCEILKCLFNVLYQSMAEELEKKVEKDMNSVLNLLRELVVKIYFDDTRPENLRVEFLSNTANLLTSVPDLCFQHLIFESKIESKTDLYKDSDAMLFYQLILDLIDKRLNENINLLETLSPLMHAMGKASLANRNIRKFCRLKVLPYMRKEVMQLPEQGSSIRNKLCKLLQHHCEQVTESVAFFLFVLCKEDVERAIKYTGFGNFAGFLARHALLAGRSDCENVYSDSEDSDTEEYLNVRDRINPVTGRVEETHSNPLEGMTEEQKEYEVVQLMNQIDKLQKQGIIKPGMIGDDGKVRPAESVLELMETISQQKNFKEENQSDSD